MNRCKTIFSDLILSNSRTLPNIPFIREMALEDCIILPGHIDLNMKMLVSGKNETEQTSEIENEQNVLFRLKNCLCNIEGKALAAESSLHAGTFSNYLYKLAVLNKKSGRQVRPALYNFSNLSFLLPESLTGLRPGCEILELAAVILWLCLFSERL